MIVMRCETLGYIPNPDVHTVRYKDNVFKFLKLGDECSVNDMVMSTPDSMFNWAVAPTVEEAVELMRRQVSDHVCRISWLKANPEDFYFTVTYSRVKASYYAGSDKDAVDKGYFWAPPSVSNLKSYRLSDGKAI